MSAVPRRRFVWPRPGVCRVCGCVDERACAGGCWWMDREHTLCSTCWGTSADLAFTVEWMLAAARKYGLAKDVLRTNTKRARAALQRFRLHNA